MKIYLTIAECMGTDGEFTSEVYTDTSAQSAGEMASSLIADMIETMDMDRNIDPTATWNLEGDGWFYRVRVEEREIPETTTLKAYATNIKWDTDGEQIDDLPTRVEIPFGVDDDEIADLLSDEYGFCVCRFDIEQVEE
jgi:hypothetical protein